jgi:hypothetical protein
MAVHTSAGVSYVGCVLATRERNWHDDSDFVAIVWDEKMQKVRSVEYDSTRYANTGSATVDATPNVLNTVRDWCRHTLVVWMLDESYNQSRSVARGRLVRSVSKRSKKFPLDTVGYAGTPYTDGYRNTVVDVDTIDGVRLYGVGVSLMEVVNPEQYVETVDELQKKAENVVSAYRDIGNLAAAMVSPKGMAFL